MARLVVLLLVALVAGALAQEHCRRDSECYKFSDKPQFVSCVSGNCTCLVDEGFTGDATASSKCRCAPFPGQEEGTSNSLLLAPGQGPLGLGLFCGNPKLAIAAQRAEANCKLHIDGIRRFFDSLIWHNDTHNPLPWIYSAIGLPSPVNHWDLIDRNFKIRALPFGEFNDPVDALLYYLVFAVNGAQIPKAWFPWIFCSGDLLYVDVDLGFGFAGTVFVNVTEVAKYTMTPDHKPISVDAYAINIPAVTAASIADKEAYMEGICRDMTMNPGFNSTERPNGFCTQEDDPIGYYANFSDCMAYLHSIPFGDFTDASQKTVVCAGEHRTMAFWRRNHCKHASKNDTAHCKPTPYDYYYQHTYKKRDAEQQFPVAGGIGPFFADLVRRFPPQK